jgi:NAD(P) transhydrogenase subunit alpha
MEDDVIRGATVAHAGEITFPPPPPKVAAIAAAPKREKPKELTPEERAPRRWPRSRRRPSRSGVAAWRGAALVLGVGMIPGPASFMQHFIVFVLSVFIGFQVIWNVSHALHTPLMAVTNAISSIIILGALIQIGSTRVLITLLAAAGIFMAAINIFGGFLVTRRMLAMFQKS